MKIINIIMTLFFNIIFWSIGFSLLKTNSDFLFILIFIPATIIYIGFSLAYKKFLYKKRSNQ